jgi:pyruvate/2-oxoglutarate dehydrogenase complex dihydrolipoamide acyltransferase (E2) component
LSSVSHHISFFTVINGKEIVYRDYVDISVAVATPTGLVTPVLRDCDKLSFADVEKEIVTLGEKARGINGRVCIFFFLI